MITFQDPFSTGFTYISRYNRIDKYEILDHNSRIIVSGNTTIISQGGKITHSGLTFPIYDNNLYTYKSYYLNDTDSLYYLATQQLIKVYWTEDYRESKFKSVNKPKNTFKTRKKLARTIVYGGTSTYVNDQIIIYGGNAFHVGTQIIEGGGAIVN